MGRLQGKVAIVTGTGSGMGRAAALAFTREGAAVVGCDINAERGAAVLAEVAAAGGTMVSLHPVDLSVADGAHQLTKFALEHFDKIDVLYNNAAMAYFAPFPEMTYETFSRTMREEVDIVFHLTREVWPHLVAAGGGSIINTASMSGKVGARALGVLAHSTAKAAVIMMTRQLAIEGAPHGIRANTISPGFVRSAQTEPLIADPDWLATVTADFLIKRPGEPEEIAAAALFLASDESSFVTGADIAVDGGYTAL